MRYVFVFRRDHHQLAVYQVYVCVQQKRRFLTLSWHLCLDLLKSHLMKLIINKRCYLSVDSEELHVVELLKLLILSLCVVLIDIEELENHLHLSLVQIYLLIPQNPNEVLFRYQPCAFLVELGKVLLFHLQLDRCLCDES